MWLALISGKQRLLDRLNAAFDWNACKPTQLCSRSIFFAGNTPGRGTRQAIPLLFDPKGALDPNREGVSNKALKIVRRFAPNFSHTLCHISYKRRILLIAIARCTHQRFADNVLWLNGRTK